eukprot:15826-Heterococcus_DN1.PRE.2
MEGDEDFQLTAARLKELGQKRMTLEEKKLRRRALDELGLPTFQQYLKNAELAVPRAASTILQLNIGLYCNQACSHCHVESSPQRTESMSREVADQCLAVLRASPAVSTLDITGGAPELNPQFRYLVQQACAAGVEVIDRCNLTVLQEPGQEDLAEFLAENKVRVVASLPCYSSKNVNMQRGSGVFDRSIAGLKKLNALGYGIEGSGLSLDLVYNPLGAFLPPPQQDLELKYKEELMSTFGIQFNSLFTITNMPIKRFADFLYRRGELKEYMDLLVRNFNPAAVKGLMCKDTVSVGWDGRIYDCDFNQQMGLGMGTAGTNTNAYGDLPTKRVTALDVLVVWVQAVKALQCSRKQQHSSNMSSSAVGSRFCGTVCSFGLGNAVSLKSSYSSDNQQQCSAELQHCSNTLHSVDMHDVVNNDVVNSNHCLLQRTAVFQLPLLLSDRNCNASRSRVLVQHV